MTISSPRMGAMPNFVRTSGSGLPLSTGIKIFYRTRALHRLSSLRFSSNSLFSISPFAKSSSRMSRAARPRPYPHRRQMPWPKWPPRASHTITATVPTRKSNITIGPNIMHGATAIPTWDCSRSPVQGRRELGFAGQKRTPLPREKSHTR